MFSADDNRITSVNGIAFANLALREVDLKKNECINTDFYIKRGSHHALRRISRNCGSNDIERKQISCITSIFCFYETYFPTTCCELEAGTFIDAPDYTFKADEERINTEYLHIRYQQNIHFLPILLHERFPDLEFYDIRSTATPKISKKNFEKLVKLKGLKLTDNQIEVIKSDTFEDLISLRELRLSKKPGWNGRSSSMIAARSFFSLNFTDNQRLTALNGQAFANLHNLEFLLLQNEGFCIDSFFVLKKDTSRLKIFEKVTKLCGYDENDFVEIPCEKFDSLSKSESCMMNGSTIINATNFIIADPRDDDIRGIFFDLNKKIEYLPYKIYMQLPILIKYSANNCSIKQISMENFEKLNRLEQIRLAGNLIQKISGNTFKGLKRLKHVDLGKFGIYLYKSLLQQYKF